MLHKIGSEKNNEIRRRKETIKVEKMVEREGYCINYKISE